MEEFFEDYETLGLPGGPNELKRFTNGFIISERGQWDYPGQPTAVPTPTGEITMQGVEDDLVGIDNLGNMQYMTPGNDYQFEGDMVYEIPQAKKGGSKKAPKKYSRSLMAKNKLFAKNPLFKKPRSVKNKIFDPYSPYFQDGGSLPSEVSVSYLPEGERSYYDPRMDAVYLDPNASEEELNHEMAHAWQNRQDGFRSDPYSPKLRPSTAASDEQAATYFNRKGDDVDRYINNLKTIAPELGGHTWNKDLDRFIPEQLKYDKVVDPLMYSDPSTLEGEAEYMSQVYGRPPLGIKQDGGAFEIELTEDEIEEYRKGGYVVEDISVPSLTRMQPGGPVPDSTYTPIDPNFLAENPDTYSQIVNKPEVSTGREGSDIGKLRAEYRDKNPMDIFLDEKKKQYLKKNKGLNKAAGVTMENFPEDVLQNFMSEYDYKTNNYAVNKLGKKEGWNPKRRGEWVDELTPGEKEAVAESKYGSKLQPSYWSRSLAGIQELGNAAIKLLPGEQGDVLKYNIPGLTKREQKEIAESKLGALETLAPMDIPGAAIANLVKNTGLTTGSDYKEQANALAGEKMANVSDTEAMAFNPLTYAGLESIPELGVNLVKGVGSGVNKLERFVKNARDMEKISKAYSPGLTKMGFSSSKPAVDFVGPMRAPAEAVSDVLTGLRKRGTQWDKAGAKGEELLHPDMINYHGTYAGRPIVEVRMPDGTPEFFYKSSGWAGKSAKDAETTAGMWQPFGGFSDIPQSKDWFIKDASELTLDGVKYKTKTFNINGEKKTLSAFDQLSMPQYNHTGRSLNGYDLIDQGKIAVDKPGYELYYGSNAYKGMAKNLDNALMQKLGFQNTDELENAFNFQNRFGNVNSYTPIRKYGGTTAKYGYSVGNLIRKDDGGSVSGTQGLTDDFSQRLTQFILDARSQGIDLGVGSGYRSYEKQEKLWKQALKKYGSPEKARKWVAPPGGSFHNKGLAVDLNSNGQFLGKDANNKATEWAHANAKKYGLHFRMGHEPWHIEPIEKSKSSSEKEKEYDHDHMHADTYGDAPQGTADEQLAQTLKVKELELQQKQKLLAEQEEAMHDDDYSNWTPAKKQAVVDPREQQLEALANIMATSNQNLFQQYNANLQGQMQTGGFIAELDEDEIERYRKGGYIIEELD